MQFFVGNVLLEFMVNKVERLREEKNLTFLPEAEINWKMPVS